MGEFDSIIAAYERRFGRRPISAAKAPGRVNLIGEHTDYNEGYVLPFAIDRFVEAAAGPCAAGKIVVHSAALNRTVTFPTDVGVPAERDAWQNYVRGVVAGLRRRGFTVESASLYIGGDLPVGAGLSSSAALCVAAGLALTNGEWRIANSECKIPGTDFALLDSPFTQEGAAPGEFDGDGDEVVRIALEAERQFAGTPCGLMDPYTCVHGRRGHALLLDCRARQHEYVPMAVPKRRFVLIDSGVRHDLATGAYRGRVEQCRAAAERMARLHPAVRTLRDVNPDVLERCQGALDEVQLRRARHVVSENARVLRAAAALRAGDFGDLGRWLRESHRSLRDDYEVSCAEIEALMTVVDSCPGVDGARMIGGGFGGSILALVHEDAVAELARRVSTASAGPVLVVEPADGARVFRL